MVDYDDAVAAVQDPQADPIFLAKIAYENPEFGANVAANPRAYPGLLRWLAEFGDDRARDVVAQLGYAVPSDALGSSQPQVRSEYDGRSGAVRVVEAVTEPEIFGKGNYFLELQDHGMDEQKQVNQGLLRLSRELGIGLVVTNDIHYTFAQVLR